MAKRLKKLQRVRQIYNWLRDQYPTPYPTKLLLNRFTPKLEKLQGLCYLDGKQLILLVNPKMPLYSMVDALFHEYAHAMVWQRPRVENARPEHCPEWGIAYASLESGFHESRGDRDSRDYPY